MATASCSCSPGGAITVPRSATDLARRRGGPDIGARWETPVAADLRPEVMKAAIGQLQLVIGHRLHAQIFTSSIGVPVAGISYERKSDSFLEASRLPQVDLWGWNRAVTSRSCPRCLMTISSRTHPDRSSPGHSAIVLRMLWRRLRDCTRLFSSRERLLARS